jgi:heat shock protein HslJ
MKLGTSNSTRALLPLFLVCLAQGCATATDPMIPVPEAPLTGTVWQLGKLGTRDALSTAQPTLEFTKVDQVAGTGSCNRFTGGVTIVGTSITFGPLAATRMACADDINAQEMQYFSALEGAQRYVIDGNALTIYTKAPDSSLLFIRKSPK